MKHENKKIMRLSGFPNLLAKWGPYPRICGYTQAYYSLYGGGRIWKALLLKMRDDMAAQRVAARFIKAEVSNFMWMFTGD